MSCSVLLNSLVISECIGTRNHGFSYCYCLFPSVSFSRCSKPPWLHIGSRSWPPVTYIRLCVLHLAGGQPSSTTNTSVICCTLEVLGAFLTFHIPYLAPSSKRGGKYGIFRAFPQLKMVKMYYVRIEHPHRPNDTKSEVTRAFKRVERIFHQGGGLLQLTKVLLWATLELRSALLWLMKAIGYVKYSCCWLKV